MQIIEYGKETVKLSECVVALGLFDGVHIGHRSLLKTAKAAADELGISAAVFTFYSEDLLPKNSSRIYSTEDKIAIFEDIGIDRVILAHFGDLANMEAEDFINEVLIKDIGCRVAVTGRDFRFGKGARGSVDLLSKTMSDLGRALIIEDEWRVGEEKISSTLIKSLLLTGKTGEANDLLGAPYFVNSRVQRGEGRGRTLGFPTVNTDIPENRDILRHGVYRTAVLAEQKLYTGVTNVGECPTFERRKTHAETYIVDYDGSLYDKDVRIFFLEHLRDERTFENKEELIKQIEKDKKTAIERNGILTWQEIGLSSPQ